MADYYFYLCNSKLLCISSVIKHLGLCQSLFDNPLLNLKCCSINRPLEFKKFNGLRRHLKYHETESINYETVIHNINSTSFEVDDNNVNTPNNDNEFCNINTDEDAGENKVLISSNQESMFELYTESDILLFLNQLLLLNLSQSTTHNIYVAVTELINRLLSTIGQLLIEKICKIDNIKQIISNYIEYI